MKIHYPVIQIESYGIYHTDTDDIELILKKVKDCIGKDMATVDKEKHSRYCIIASGSTSYSGHDTFNSHYYSNGHYGHKGENALHWLLNVQKDYFTKMKYLINAPQLEEEEVKV